MDFEKKLFEILLHLFLKVEGKNILHHNKHKINQIIRIGSREVCTQPLAFEDGGAFDMLSGIPLSQIQDLPWH